MSCECPEPEVMEAIGRSALFSALPEDALTKVCGYVEERSYLKGEVIFHDGDPGDSLLIIGSGEVEVIKVMGESPHVLSKLGPGQYVGEMAMISNEPRSATIRAATDVTGFELSRGAFDALLDEEPMFSREMLRAVTERLRKTDESALQRMIDAHEALTFALAKLADSRDPETGGHLYRVREYCVLLSELIREHPKYQDEVTNEFIQNIYLVAPLHDIGKVAIPDGILLKQGKLTDAEFEIMSAHTTLGAQAVDTVLEFCDFELFRMAKRVILCHHERWDGLGYPRGMQGETIPLEARIMTLADVYDALLSERVYKAAFTYDEAKDELRKNAGVRFDPDLVAIMLEHIGRFEDVHQKFSEDTPDYSTVD